MLYLAELKRPDPRVVWNRETQRLLISGIDQVFHFFFDDNDFDESALGVTLLNHSEVASVQDLKTALRSILDSVGLMATMHSSCIHSGRRLRKPQQAH